MDRTHPQLLIGADPEMFLVDRAGNFKSSIGLIGGSKEYPAPMGRPGFFVQEDNVATEFNIPPAPTKEVFVESISWAVSTIQQRVNEIGLDIRITSSAFFAASELSTPEARVFGCTPDYDVYEGGMPNPRPTNVDPTLRTCGGHVHIGYPEKDDDVFSRRLIRACDLFLGVPSVLVDADMTRHNLYGKAGCYRPTSYGVEYRTLSNWWIVAREYAEWVYDQTRRAYDYMKAGDLEPLRLEGENIRTIINTHDMARAQTLMEKFHIAPIPRYA